MTWFVLPHTATHPPPATAGVEPQLLVVEIQDEFRAQDSQSPNWISTCPPYPEALERREPFPPAASAVPRPSAGRQATSPPPRPSAPSRGRRASNPAATSPPPAGAR